MKYLILAKEDHRIMHISDTMNYQSNGNYLIYNDSLAIPPVICDMVEVAAIPEGVEPEKWCYVGGKFVPNANWTPPPPTQDELAQRLAECEDALIELAGLLA